MSPVTLKGGANSRTMATYTYSQLSAETAVKLVTDHYGIAGSSRGKFYVLGLHDNFLIEGEHERFILRVYRNDWRSPKEIFFELELLAFLREKRAAVAWPVPTTSGALSVQVACPEGERIAALFPYAKGYAPEENIEPAQCALLGEVVADIHGITDSFASNHQRPVLDANHLVKKSIEAVIPFLDSESKEYMESLGDRLCRSWPAIPCEEGAFGVCIGDVNAKNFHIDDRARITLFDFDQCGYGYRAFEIAKFISTLRSHPLKRELVDAFLFGYQKKRPLSRAEHQAIPYFTLVAVIWVMAIQAMNANRIGHKYLEKRFWDKRIEILKKLAAQQAAAAEP